MSEAKPIGLAELIEQVKSDLLHTETDDQRTVPLFSVDTVELELQVTVRREGKGRLKIYVLELGGSSSRDDVQKLKVTLTPLLSKEERIHLLKERYPEGWKVIEKASVKAFRGRQAPQKPYAERALSFHPPLEILSN
jgi:hypothetical protein